MKATVHVDGCPTLAQAQRQIDNPPPAIRRASILEEERYLAQSLRVPQATPVEHRCCKATPQREETHVLPKPTRRSESPTMPRRLL